MPMKPFRPPLIRRLETLQAEIPTGRVTGGSKERRARAEPVIDLTNSPDSSSPKRRRLNGNQSCSTSPLTGAHDDSGYGTASSEKACPLQLVSGGGKHRDSDSTRSASQVDEEKYYTVLWRRFTLKKNKTWDGDGILIASKGYVALQDISGKSMGRTMFSGLLCAGSTLSIGGKDVEVECEMSRQEYLSGRSFLPGNGKEASPVPPTVSLSVSRPGSRGTPGGGQSISGGRGVKAGPRKQTIADLIRAHRDGNAAQTVNGLESERPLNVSVKSSLATKSAFKPVVTNNTTRALNDSPEPTPRHDPRAAGAVVMRRPSKVAAGRRIVDVVVDPLLSRHLREHQKEGVKFMYECIMGMRPFDGEGCILADDMGLGKTLQTITLLWTLLKQNPVHGAPPVAKKALIVCPVTLISNWRKEFRKWLGGDRIGVFVADGTRTRLTDFTKGKTYSVMIIGYERLRNVQEELAKGDGIDIVVADEGHRLKTVQNKSAQAIQSLNTARRIILSGTPIQNDLSEFFAMVDFVNPGLLGSFKTFMREFEGPIVRSRQPHACSKDIEKGKARSDELARLSSQFILRRTAQLLEQYLPPKTEYVLLCNPTPTQASIYRLVLQTSMFQCALGNAESALQLITILKKLCNSPSLLALNQDDTKQGASALATLSEFLPPGFSRHFTPGASGKIRVLDQLLHTMSSTTDEKIVLVSNYTSTLDALAVLLASLSLPFLRLDGSTPPSKRQSLVDEFNRSSARSCFAFLLSAKAGGTGLNLIGASRLVLFDVDWNPATDLQAMARIHRDGQTRHCRIYRFVLKGSLEEKIWQRQITKVGLADSVMDQRAGVSAFSREELRDLFRLDEGEECQTHELLGCACGGLGGEASQEMEGVGGGEGDHTDEDSEDEEDVACLVKASELSPDQIKQPLSRRTRRREAGQKQLLMQYQHIHPERLMKRTAETALRHDRETTTAGDEAVTQACATHPQLEQLIDDDMLVTLLKEHASGVGFLFKKDGGSALEPAAAMSVSA